MKYTAFATVQYTNELSSFRKKLVINWMKFRLFLLCLRQPSLLFKKKIIKIKDEPPTENMYMTQVAQGLFGVGLITIVMEVEK